METVDIIMPVHNCEKYVKEAIASVKNQTYKTWNLIIVDDYSTDKSYEIIEKEIEDIKNKAILIKNDKRQGISKTRNKGIEQSKNKYIAFLDADDIWNYQKLEKQIKFMKENNYTFTYTSFYYKKQKGNKQVGIFPKKLNYKQALKNTFILTSTVIINKEKIDEKLIKMPEIESEDTATWWNILKNNNIAYGLNENLTEYRVHQNGTSFDKIKNIRRTWNLYRKHENLGVVKSMYYFINYAINASIKRIL